MGPRGSQRLRHCERVAHVGGGQRAAARAGPEAHAGTAVLCRAERGRLLGRSCCWAIGSWAQGTRSSHLLPASCPPPPPLPWVPAKCKRRGCARWE